MRPAFSTTRREDFCGMNSGHKASAYAYLPLLVIFILTGCETPERRNVGRRLDKLQLENSGLRAKAATEVADVKLAAVRQRQEDLKLIESMNARFDELAKKIDELKSAAPAPKVTPDAPQKKPEPASDNDLQRARQEMEAKLKEAQATVEKAQAQAETSKLAAVTTENIAAGKKPEPIKGKKLPLAKYIDSTGELVDINQYIGKKIVVLAIMRGFASDGICIYCTKQTSELAKNIKEINDLGAEVLVVYPGREEQIEAFVKSIREYEKSTDPRFKLPFKVLLDVNQDVVRVMNIIGDLALPTVFIVDKEGVVRYQHVGRTISDRPPVKTLLDEIKKLGGGTP
jgi:thioredoxin-dependent peroxiredoxin